ncbi:hypothetical protein Droror1_Dr00020817 [Drosera rotundifolia]
MLCYSIRAAIRISLGRIREALQDCMAASDIDSSFLRVQLRTASCFLALEEVGDASRYFKKLLNVGTDVCVDRKLLLKASEGLQNAKLRRCEEVIQLCQQSLGPAEKNAPSLDANSQ